MASATHFCNQCGAIKDRATAGVLRCAKCGLIGLIPCSPSDPPHQVKCPQRGCAWSSFSNGQADDYLTPHLVRAHPRSQRAKSSIGVKKRCK